MNNLIQKEKSLANHTIFDTAIVDTLLANPNHHHYFFKYFMALSSIYSIYFDRQFLQSCIQSLEKDATDRKTLDKSFQLYEFLYGYGRYELCRQLVERIVQVLTKQMKHQPDVWTYLFRACCALVQVHNQGLEMKEAWARIEAANEIADNLKATGIGTTTLTRNDFVAQTIRV